MILKNFNDSNLFSGHFSLSYVVADERYVILHLTFLCDARFGPRIIFLFSFPTTSRFEFLHLMKLKDTARSVGPPRQTCEGA